MHADVVANNLLKTNTTDDLKSKFKILNRLVIRCINHSISNQSLINQIKSVNLPVLKSHN